MESHQVTIVITKECVERAARRFLRRFIIRSSAADLVFVAMGAILGFTGVFSPQLALGWIAAGLGIIALVFLVAWKYVRSSKARFSALTDPQITYRCNESSFGTKSCLGSMEIPWTTISEIWKFDDVWLLFFGNQGYSMFPVSLVALDVASFVEERVKSNGGKVS